MRIFADLQLHILTAATSKNMNLKELAHFASMKGLNLVERVIALIRIGGRR